MGKERTERHGMTLLLVDDNRDNLFILCQVIAEHLPQCTLLTASNGREGLVLAASRRLDGVLIDLQMPEMDGIGMCRQLKAQERTANVPVVLITSHVSSARLRAEGLDAGAEDFISRPIDNLELVARIRTILRMKDAEDRLLLANAELEQRVAEQTASLRNYQKAVEGTQDPIATLDRQYRYLVVNDAYLRYHDLQREQVLGRTWSEVLGEKYFTQQSQSVFEQLLRGEQVTLESSLQVPRLGLRHLLKNFAPMFAADGQVSGMVIVMRDITERKQAEGELRKKRKKYKQLSAQFQALLDGIPDVLMLLSPQRQVVWANRAADKYFDGQRSKLVGTLCSQLWQCASFPCPQCPAEQAFVDGTNQETLKRSADGRYWLVKVFPLHDQEDVTHVIMLASDITEKTKLREEALRSSRLASLGELAAGVAHEINNPNGLVLLNVPLLLDIWPDLNAVLEQHYRQQGDFSLGRLNYLRLRDEIPRMLNDIHDGGKRIKTIVEDLKGFVRHENTENFESVNINLVAEAAVRLVTNQINQATRSFSVSYAAELPQIRGSFQRLEQVLINLLINACQALPDLDRGISLRTCLAADRSMVLIELRDEGRGIREEHLAHITDPFFTTRRDSGGTGLGLSVSSRLINEHGGRLEFSSVLGEGTTVNLFLPIISRGEGR